MLRKGTCSSIDQVSNDESSHDLIWGDILVNTLWDQVGEKPKAIPNECIFRANIEIRLNEGLTRGIMGMNATINSMHTKEYSNYDET